MSAISAPPEPKSIKLDANESKTVSESVTDYTCVVTTRYLVLHRYQIVVLKFGTWDHQAIRIEKKTLEFAEFGTKAGKAQKFVFFCF